MCSEAVSIKALVDEGSAGNSGRRAVIVLKIKVDIGRVRTDPSCKAIEAKGAGPAGGGKIWKNCCCKMLIQG